MKKVKFYFNQEAANIKDVLSRLKRRDFSGNTGLVVKNSMYQLSTNFVMKIGSLIFMIVLARLLMPEFFGLYNLALSTILLFFSISNLGFGPTLVTYVSRELRKSHKRMAKAYVKYLWKIRILSALISIFLLLTLAKFISEGYYGKPIFLALVAGAIYIFFYGIATFFDYVLQSVNYFKGILYKESIIQIMRVVLVPVAVIIALKYAISDDRVLFYIFLITALIYALITIFLFLIVRRKAPFMAEPDINLNQKQKKKVNRFFVLVSATMLSGLFFQYVDKIMLGHYVGAEFIGYYSAALGLVGALSALGTFGPVLLPIFSRAKGKVLDKGLKKTIVLSLLASVSLVILINLFAPLIIKIVYGSEYSPAINLLRLLSLILIPVFLTGNYDAYFTSKRKPQIVAKILIMSTFINIALNYFFITYLLQYGELAAVFGAGVASIISQFFYLGGLIFKK